MNEKKERFVSPLGVAMYAFTAKPDTQFKADGTYRIDLVLDKQDDSGFLKELAKDAKDNAGKGAKYTRGRLPVTLLYAEPADNRATASQREAAIKKLGRAAKLRLIS